MTENSQAKLPDWMIFIGKWGESIDGHPLAYHLLDSAAVAGLLWRDGLTTGAREQFSRWLNLPEEDCGRLLAYWTSLHDLGKATPTFQMKHAPSQEKLRARGFDFPDMLQMDIRHHSLLSQWILKDFTDDLGIQPRRLFNLMRFAIGGHHGTFHAQEDHEDSLAGSENLGSERWQQARRNLFDAVTGLLNPPDVPELKLGQTERNAFFNLLTGFFVAVDWISSQNDLFRYSPATPDLNAYWIEAQTRAARALLKTGWIGWQPDGEHPDFTSLFGFAPHLLQSIILQRAEQLQDPFLMIIEAPTGSGKTEAALIAADRAMQTGNLRGLYIAMPTQATSNQMFDRTKNFLEKRFPAQKNINLHLVHGNAIINEGFQEMRVSGVEDLEGCREGNVNAQEWFLPRKRSLLTPFGVGTVDQTFLGVLRARHSFLRLFGLHRKVVIFDEVHAYDMYMMEIFSRLLAWLRAIGSSVIILSATLPEKTRLELLQSYQPAAAVLPEKMAYPRMSINDGQTISTTSLGTYPNRTVRIERISRNPQTWLGSLREKLAEGGCAAVICNTVDRAQAVYCQIRDASIVAEDKLFLLHARMPYCWRKQREDEILERFGKQKKDARTPRSGIVIATQIIEQSLDLDFDLLITDLAPVDLLIQRIGRLQRHTGSEYAPLRPPLLHEPLCLICEPDAYGKDDLPYFEKDIWVYEPAILQRTYFALLPYQFISLPADSDALINAVYSMEPLSMCSNEQNKLIHENLRSMNARQEGEIASARNRMIADVDQSNALDGRIAYLNEDDQATMEAASALTRNSDLVSVKLVCFVKQNGKLNLLDEDFIYSPSTTPDGKAVRHALKSMVSLSKSVVVDYFTEQQRVDAWKKIAALRNAYPAIFEKGECPLNNGIRLILDKQIGITIG